jgi:hypothetical protein
MRRSLAAVALVLATVLAATDALADRVATLHSRGVAPEGDRATVYKAADAATKALGHTGATEAEVLSGEGAAGDLIGTSAGLVAVGKATSSDWVVEATVSSNASGMRVEMKACQVSTGRVEMLARDIDPKQDIVEQIRQMLALMLRPQGVGDDPLPWNSEKKPKPPETKVEPKKPPEPKTPAEPPPNYGEGGLVAVGGGGGALYLASRPQNASGSRLAGTWSIEAAVALPTVPHLELTARGGGFFIAAGALRAEFGARYLLPFGRLAFGLGVGGGILAQTSGAKTVRPLLAVDPLLAFAITKRIELDLSLASFRFAPGDAGALVFVGADLGLLARF